MGRRSARPVPLDRLDGSPGLRPGARGPRVARGLGVVVAAAAVASFYAPWAPAMQPARAARPPAVAAAVPTAEPAAPSVSQFLPPLVRRLPVVTAPRAGRTRSSRPSPTAHPCATTRAPPSITWSTPTRRGELAGRGGAVHRLGQRGHRPGVRLRRAGAGGPQRRPADRHAGRVGAGAHQLAHRGAVPRPGRRRGGERQLPLRRPRDRPAHPFRVRPGRARLGGVPGGWPRAAAAPRSRPSRCTSWGTSSGWTTSRTGTS